MNRFIGSLWLQALTATSALGIAAAGGPAEAAGRIEINTLQAEGPFNRFIVKYRDDSAQFARPESVQRHLEATSQRAVSLNRNGAAPLVMGHIRRLAVGADVVSVGRGLDRAEAETLMRELAADPDVEYVEVDRLNKPFAVPNDTRYSEQWHYFDPTGGLNLPAAWDISTGSGVVVAVLDTGITNHSDLNANVVAGYDFINDTTVAGDGNGRDADPSDPGDFEGGYASSWHGTHVAGTIAAVTNNAKGVAGVAYGAKISPVRVLGRGGGYDSDISDAIIWASGGTVSGVPANANPAKVINLSLGGSGACGTTFQNAINGAVGRGSVMVIAAGNSNANVSGFSPANCNNVIAVAANGKTGARASYSNYGTLIDVTAPGGDGSYGVLSTLNAGSTTPGAESYDGTYMGTSMAAPHVAGVAALILSVVNKTPAQIETILKSSARALPGACTGGCGAGIVNAYGALQAATNGGGTDPEPPTGNVLTNNVPATGLAGSANTELRYTLEVPAGSSNLTIATSEGTGDADLYVKFGAAPTTSLSDCRPYKSGNAESCAFAAPQAGTYHVMVRGYSTFAGVKLLGTYTAGTGGGQSFFENTTDFSILDSKTIESPIAVSGRSGNAPSTLKVGVSIYHTYQGDLKVDLIAPDGSVYVLHNYTGSSTDNIITTYTVNASSEVANGTWKLRVNDKAAGDTGYLDKWNLQF
ncbi:serine protease [Stigmatella aurantiaca]|uniref:Serine protease n=1 Tax=Stigmatella aurantiaca TaxID=41 RepID=A0A1H7VYU8_STIAU|nr:S8 family serine peptidase [Stigmatella aurantiaca]SEM14380.1 serine protease [Stigmatella aurantiaca]